MSKIFSLREQLSISEAARYLQEKLNQSVEARDVLDLILHHKLNLFLSVSEYFYSFQISDDETWTADKADQYLSSSPNYPEATQTPPDSYLFPAVGSNRLTILELFNGQETYGLALLNRPKPLFAINQTDNKLLVIAHRFPSGTTISWFNVPDYSSFIVKRANLDELIDSISTTPQHDPEQHNVDRLDQSPEDQMSIKKEEALLKTIGALAKLAAHLGGNDVGTFDKPNAQGLLKKLETLADKGLLDGLGKSTWINRIGKGKEAFERSKIK